MSRVRYTTVEIVHQSESEMSEFDSVSYGNNRIHYTYLCVLQKFETESPQLIEMSYGVYTRKQPAYRLTGVEPRKCGRLLEIEYCIIKYVGNMG